MSESDWPINVGITGPRGFIACHLSRYLAQASTKVADARSGTKRQRSTANSLGDREVNVLSCTRETVADASVLAEFVEHCDTLVHLAGISRGTDREIYDNNAQLADKLIAALDSTRRRPHIIFASSPQRDRSSAYGRSK